MDPAAVMLVLAGLAYRGFYFLRILRVLEDPHERAVRRAVAAGLRAVAPVIGEWELVWGPATKDRDDFDQSAMYVARSKANPQRLAVAIRGTDPISITDWTRGDLDVAQPSPWPFGAAGATVSGSTASGLNTLLELAEPPPSRLGELVEEAIFRVSGFVPDAFAAIVRRIPRDPALVLDLITTRLRKDFEQWRRRIEDEGAQVVAEAVVLLLKELSERRIQVMDWPSPAPTGSGATLLDFLMRASKDGALEVLVTGHSKGGALAPALALFLAETRSRWDLNGNASIGCYAFAGPTPGNAAFGQRVNAQLGREKLRVINTSDIVTHAWDQAGLKSIALLYAGSLAWMAPILDAVSREVTQTHYAPVGLPTCVFDGLATAPIPADDAALEIPYQHLESYLAYFGLLDCKPRIDTLMLLLGEG
ncbi:MAG TPA: hypothetical protein DEP35_16255 [Deltaproteobacteria bacterium]|jgi:hypothetical protein|nr:hypothetical protein [Deltaproteobacteria bacterium]